MSWSESAVRRSLWLTCLSRLSYGALSATTRTKNSLPRGSTDETELNRSTSKPTKTKRCTDQTRTKEAKWLVNNSRKYCTNVLNEHAIMSVAQCNVSSVNKLKLKKSNLKAAARRSIIINRNLLTLVIVSRYLKTQVNHVLFYKRFSKLKWQRLVRNLIERANLGINITLDLSEHFGARVIFDHIIGCTKVSFA